MSINPIGIRISGPLAGFVNGGENPPLFGGIPLDAGFEREAVERGGLSP